MATAGKKWYNNGITSKMCESQPDGWVPGRLKNFADKCAETKLEKYGSATFNNRDKAKTTCLEKYGFDNPFKDTAKIKQSYIDKLGVDHPMHDLCILDKVISQIDYEQAQKKREGTNLTKTGYTNPFSNPEVMGRAVKARVDSGQYINNEHTIETCMEKYGVAYPCMTEQARVMSSSNSKPNNAFADLLDANNITYTREFALGKYSFDFKVGNKLIEIDPAATHNSSWGIRGNGGIDKNYHCDKTNYVKSQGYRCIHVFDWDDASKICNILQPRKRIYARNCNVKEVSITEAKEFLNTYHLQGYARDEIRIGLYYNEELVQIMTFGKPRYNMHYEYELIRLCGSYHVIGGAEKLFKHFLTTYNPTSIISYCDASKFAGDVYTKLGFTYKSTTIGKHWYNIKTGKHITDNLLRQRGFDQLLGESFGKGTNNEELMLSAGFCEIYDAGQNSYIYNIV